MLDVLIIGAGIVGCSTARFLRAYDLSVAVVEALADVADGVSKANSGIVHAGYDAQPGTKKAHYNVLGNAMFDQLQQELDFAFTRNGSLILCFDEADKPTLQALYEQGVTNGVPGLEIINAERLREMEPHVSQTAVAALYAPTGGIVCPYGMTQAMAENAASNGVAFYFNAPVTRIAREADGFSIQAGAHALQARVIINAAGLYADEISRMASGMAMELHPRRGEYCIFDKRACYVKHTLFQLPGPLGKGVLVTPTVHGNMMVGPTAQDIEDKTDRTTTAMGIDEVLSVGARSVDRLPTNMIITSFAGLRPKPVGGDFIIGADTQVKGLYHAAGIESPGLTAAPAIAHELAQQVAQALNAQPNTNYNPIRKGIPAFAEMTAAERKAAIADDPAYGHIVCRCETVTEAEVVQTIRRSPGARNLDAIKRRIRTGMGRCQGGFCTPRLVDILCRELNITPEEVLKDGNGSNIILGSIKEEPPCVP